MKQTTVIALMALTTIFMGCAKERPVKSILSNGRRVEKSQLEGTYLFQKTVSDAQFTADSKKYEGVPRGSYEIADVLVQFKLSEKNLDVLAVDPLFKEERAALQSTLLARFPIKHVDVLRKQNADGEDTNEEEETESRRQWKERSYIVIDTDVDTQEPLSADTKSIESSDGIEIDSKAGAINFTVKRIMNDQSVIGQRYSFLKFNPSSTYQQKEYPAELQTRFGFFKTTALKFDAYGRMTQTDKKEFINRWDTSKTITYYLSKNYPEHLIAPTKKVFAQWNEAFKAALGRDVLEVQENSGQELGDLRYSMITYDDTVDAAHGILGYGPTYTNPRTGEIIKGDVILYGGVLKNSVYRERIWEKLLGSPITPSDRTGGTPNPVSAALNNIRNSRQGMPLNLELLSGLDTLLRPGQLDTELKQAVRTEFHPSLSLQTHRNKLLNELHKSVTRVNEGFFSTLAESAHNLSDNDLEISIFMPLLTHELGHNWGLRHNFMGSTDEKHFGRNAKTSSIMDYEFLTSHGGTEPHPYDKAAILISYGESENRSNSALQQNYYYCTDEDTFSSQNAMCNRFDAGSNLTEVANNLYRRYQASWILSNNRLDRVFFNTRSSDYRSRVLMSLLSIRFIHDNAVGIIKANEQKDLGAIWTLTRQRVEADPASRPGDVQKVKVLSGYKVEGESKNFVPTPVMTERSVDTKKIETLVKDAELAKAIALSSLRDILMDQKRPDYDLYDGVRGDLQVRGVLFDKMIALELLAARMPSPTGDGTVVTTLPIGDEEPVLATVLRQVISNVVLPGEPGSPINPDEEPPVFDINLRELGVLLIKEELSTSGLASVVRQLLAVERITPNTAEESQKKLAEYDTQMRTVLKSLYKGNLTPEEQKKAQEQIQKLNEDRDRNIPFAQTTLIGDQVFKAPLVSNALGTLTASGLLIHEGITPYEQAADAMLLAAREIHAEIQAEKAKPEPATEEEKKKVKDLIAKMTARRDQLVKTHTLLLQVVESQRMSLTDIYKAYDPR